MTTQEIKDLIASAIAGQGNQVDSGGKLAEILNEIVDMAGQGGGNDSILALPNTYSVDTSLTLGETFEQIAEDLGITAEQAQNLFTGKYFLVKVTVGIGEGTASFFVPALASQNSEGAYGCIYNLKGGGVNISIECTNDAGGANVELSIQASE